MARGGFVLLLGFFIALVISGIGSSVLIAKEVLTNGGFEQGLSGWTSASGSGISSSGDCNPRSGGGVMNVAANSTVVFRSNDISVSADSVTVRGYFRRLSGEPKVSVTLYSTGTSGDLQSVRNDYYPGNGYSQFSFVVQLDEVSESLYLRIAVDDGATPLRVCMDDLSLDVNIADTPTPSATATATSAPPSPTSSATPVPTAVANTPVPTATRSVAPAPTPQGQADAGGGGNGMSFINGGFESGLSGWEKFGGELRSVSSPAYSGSRAGALESATTSTKWAFQTVAIDPARAYEFGGYLRADAGVQAAYLRISWYESEDGSGSLISSSDSIETLNGATGGYVFLTTGAVSPPSSAASAKVRVMLTPSGAGYTTVYMDELTFATAAASVAAPTSTTTVLSRRPGGHRASSRRAPLPGHRKLKEERLPLRRLRRAVARRPQLRALLHR